MPDIKEINYILAIAECGSISKAAEMLYISQPSLSQYISRIEQEQGLALFSRDHGGVKLTEAGEIYVRYARKIYRLNETMRREINNLQNRYENRIRVCMSLNASSFSADLLQEKLREKYPQAELELVNAMARDIPGGLKKGEYSLGVGPDVRDDDSVDYKYLTEEYLLLAVPKEFPEPKCTEYREGLPYPWLDMKRLPPMDFILQDRACSINRWTDKLFAESGYRPKKSSIMANSMMTISAAEKGLGCCFISQAFMPYVHDKERVRFYCVGDEVLKTVSGVMHLRDKKLSPQEEYCITLIKELMQQGN